MSVAVPDEARSGPVVHPRDVLGLPVPERLTERMDVGVPASDLGVHPVPLGRLVRYATARGWVALDRHGRVRPKPVMTFLRADHPGGWRSWVEFMGGEEILAAIGKLDAGMGEHGDPFATAAGAPFFDWPSSQTVCDVGGGTGALLETLLGAHPHLHGVLFELPQVIERARPSDRMTLVGGDAFTEVPAGCGTYRRRDSSPESGGEKRERGPLPEGGTRAVGVGGYGTDRASSRTGPARCRGAGAGGG